MQTEEKKRRFERIRLAQPIIGRFGPTAVVLIDVSIAACRIEHNGPLPIGQTGRLTFVWDDQEISVEGEVTRCKLERFSSGQEGLTVYHSGIQFTAAGEASVVALRSMIAAHIRRALDEQRDNARGVVPRSTEKMPIFSSGGLLTSNASDVRRAIGDDVLLPSLRIAKHTGYVCYRLTGNSWKRTRTDSAEQPENGFTVSAAEEAEQIEKLCDAYARSDDRGRGLIRLLAQLSITEGEGIPPGRFEP